jgi:proline dehydrogenase
MNIARAIKDINPNAEFTYQAEDINTIQWLNGTTPIPKADIEAKMVELQAEYDANQYQRDRATAYPSIQEQLDMQYWDNVNGTTNWEDAIAKVKADNPKS